MTLGLDYTASADAAAIPFAIFGLILLYLARDIEHWPRNLCAAALLSSIVCAIVGLVEANFDIQGAAPEVLRITRLLLTLTSPIPPLLMFAFILWCSGEDWRRSRSMHIMGALTVFLMVAASIATLSAPDGAPSGTGPFRYVSLAAVSGVAAISAFTLYSLIRRWKLLTPVQRITFLASFLSPSSLQLIFIELLLMSDLAERYLEQKEEAARNRARVAVLQMRPHFIHNTLTSIYYLCDKDPRAAQQVILDFSRYLQDNFTAIGREDTIPFEKELEHTRAYLAVEQACHKDRLFVEFDTPVTFFRIPPLTLQPIVENAVKHGMDPDAEPLHISVETRETHGGVEIVVEDSGRGYTPPADGSDSFALDNIRERLRMKCDGTLRVESSGERGTRVTVTIPLAV